MRIIAISGLGADKRVFDYLKLNAQIIVIDWINPERNEKIENYAKRLIEKNELNKNDCILGVSFGGLVAVEISKQLKSEFTILISSAQINDDLRFVFRFLGKLKLVNLLPKYLLNPPRFIAQWIFGAENKDLLFKILDDTDMNFAKWAIKELVLWKNKERLSNCLKINGEKDKLMPNRNDLNAIIIKNGAHFMIVDKSNEISELINSYLHTR